MITPSPDQDETARAATVEKPNAQPRSHGVQFAPGTIIAGRYRISGILGSGGMGEVYRADDTKLDQPVALKFLPARLARDPILLGRLHDEVRLGRQIAHPNVCRIYDIVEWENAHFVAMEYVDGEDLSRLLRRIGRLPSDKAIDIARGIAAGLLAAHAKGILHRDLKPANVMLDSRGDARITDFGLALSASDEQDGEIAGTPAYMAPEQLQGAPATVQSDLYALGLLMYELFTGKRVHAGKTFPDRLRESTSEIPSPSEHIRDLDPAVERVLLRCLSIDPSQRPRSAREVIEALPGGDPLAAAMAAGETPSPRIVAAAGAEGSLAPRVAWPMLGTVAILFALVMIVRQHPSVTVRLTEDQSPEVLRHRAVELLRRFGVPTKGSPIVAPRHLQRASSDQSVLLRLEYGVGPTESSVEPLLGTAPGRVTIEVDLRGRLASLLAVPEGPWKPRALDWQPLLTEAGLDGRTLRPIPPTHVPPAPFDARAAWIGTQPSIRVEAAAWQGTPVWFKVLDDAESGVPTPQNPVRDRLLFALIWTMIFAAMLMALRNLRLRRGDRQSALRLGALGMALTLTHRLVTTQYDPRLHILRHDLWTMIGIALLDGAFVYIVYLALEPFMRRRWPEKLIAWSRLLAGRFRDPMVGRDVLIGMIGGLLFLTVALLVEDGPHVGSFWSLFSVRHALAGVILGTRNGFYDSFIYMTLLAILTMILRRRPLAIAVFYAIALTIMIGVPNLQSLPGLVLTTAVMTFVAVRYGLLSLMAFFTTSRMLTPLPALAGVSWPTPLIAIPCLALALLALWAFRISLGSNSPFGAIVENYER